LEERKDSGENTQTLTISTVASIQSPACNEFSNGWILNMIGKWYLKMEWRGKSVFKAIRIFSVLTVPLDMQGMVISSAIYVLTLLSIYLSSFLSLHSLFSFFFLSLGTTIFIYNFRSSFHFFSRRITTYLAVHLRILMNYLQMIVLIFLFNMDWPQNVTINLNLFMPLR
jgi:hypothetical protein